MLTFRILFACTVFASFLPGPALAQPCGSLATIEWLLGTWEAENEGTVTREIWQQVSPATFEGRGEVTHLQAGQSGSTETLRLVEMSGAVYYFAKVSHNALPVAFSAIDCSDHTAVFVNPEHDFPTRLAYRLGADGRLVVDVSDGASNGFTLEFELQE